MIINIQAPEVSKLLFEMFAALPPDVKKSFAPRVYKITEILEHPCCSDGAVLLTIGDMSNGNTTETDGNAAGREGWEQAKREAVETYCNVCGQGCPRDALCNDMLIIAAMEYKERTNG